MLIFWLAGLALLGCDKEKAQKALKDATSKLSKEYEESKVLAHAQRFIGAVESRDMATLKRLCSDRDCADYEAIMTCYYNAFAIENEQGVDAARGYLADEMAKGGKTPAKDKAVAALNEYFKAKGTLRTKEVAGLVLIIALEAKYPHKGGVIGRVIAEKLGLMDLPRSPTRPGQEPPHP
jgi:hypothetical protein